MNPIAPAAERDAGCGFGAAARWQLGTRRAGGLD
jgi:hypothetical protein